MLSLEILIDFDGHRLKTKTFFMNLSDWQNVGVLSPILRVKTLGLSPILRVKTFFNGFVTHFEGQNVF